VALADGRLDRAGLRLATLHPSSRLAYCAARLGSLDWKRHTWETVGRAEGRLAAELRHLHALSPQRTLERGYAVVTGPDGAVVRRAGDLAVGDPVGVRLGHGRLSAVVTGVSHE
jgi:exodeoxyribonuclease VII large subunit